MTKKIILHNLEKIRFIIKDATNLDIAYAYDDLVFSEHAILLIQFDLTDSNKLYVWFNKETDPAVKNEMFRSLCVSSDLNKVMLECKGLFEMNQIEGEENISLKFLENI